MAEQWTDRIVGARMAVDSEFEDRVSRSDFSRQQWSLVMTAVEFDIEHPSDPDRAQIVADTENLPAILPELDNVETMNPMGATERGGGGSGGIFESLKSALGFGGNDEKQQDAAEQLAAEYADRLQQHIEQQGTWDEIRTIASDSS